jgi:viral A-type inclusion repeat-containing protein
MKIFYNKHGSLTVFMSLILTIVMIFTTVLIDGGRIILARNIVSGAGDMALNAGLTYYNSVLQDTYGLFAISKNMTELHDNLEVYFEATLKSSGLHDQGLVKELVDIALSGSGSDEISDIMKMKLANGGFEVSQAAGANLSNANILRAQVLDYMKYRAPAVIGYGFLEKMNILKSLPAQQKALEDKKDYEKKLKEIQDLCLRIYKKSRDYEDYLKDPNGYFKTPQEIKHDIYYWGDENFKYSTQDAVAYVQVEKLPELGSEEVWTYNNHDPSGADLEYYVNNFENIIIKTRSDFAGMEYYKSKDIPISNSETKAFLESSRFTRYIIYYNRYKEDVAEFHKVNASYETSKLDHEKIIKDLNDDKDKLSEDNETGRDKIDEEIAKEEARWGKLENWYNKDFLGSEPLDNYSEDLLVKKPYGPSYDLNLLRDRYLSNIKQDIKLLATPQMRTARDYYLWFDELNKKAVDIKSELVKLKSASEQLQNIADNWNVDIGNMAESGVKNDMHQDYATKTKAVIEGYVDEMIKIFQRSIDYSSKVTANLKEFKYAGITPATDAGSDDQWVDGIISYVSNLTNQDSLKWNEEVISKQEALHTLGAYTPTEDSNLLFLNFENNIPEKIKRVVETKENAKGYKLVDSEFDYKDPKLRNFLGVECYDAGSKYYVDPLFAFLEKNSMATKPDGDSEKKSQRDNMIKGTGIDNTPEPVQISGAQIADVMNTSAQAAQIMDANSVESLQNGGADKLADNALKTSNEAISGFDKIGDILVGGRDKLYLMAYTTTMFSCYTTNREESGGTNEKTLSGVPFSEKNNEAYRAEQEYILLGNPDLKADVEGVKTRIFGVRFLLNAIYAYTSDSELRNETLVMATSIAGWTGFGVPIVQNVLLLASALTESVLDVNDLVSGKTVALYKNRQVWRARYFRGIVQAAAKTAANTLYKKMNEYTDDAKEEFDEALEDYVDNMVDTSTDTIITSIQTPIQEKVLWCTAQVGDARDGLEDRLKTALKESLDKMQADIEAEVANGGLVAKAKLEAFKTINNSETIDKLVNAVMQTSGITSENVNQLTESINDSIKLFFDGKRRELEDAIHSVIDNTNLKEKLKNSVGSALDAANSSAQEAINNKINEFNKEFEGAGGDAIAIGDGNNKLELNGFDKTKASTFEMSYKDYLMVFLAIQYLVDEQSVICRMGNLIQTNASKEGSLYYAGEGFSMQKATVLLQVKAEAQIHPVFMNLETFNNNNKKFILGDDQFGYPIDYKGVLGY